MKLKKPIIFFDLETTGVNVATDRIVEIGIIKLNVDGTEEEKNVVINPTIDIPKEASDIHGITDVDVKDCPKFSQIAKSMHSFLEGCDLSGYNLKKFDLPLIVEEFLRCGIDFPAKDTKVVDPFVILRLKEPRDLTSAYKKYCGKELEGAHGASADIKATKEILFAQMEQYDDMPSDVDGLHDFCNDGQEVIDYAGKLTKNEAGDVVFTFGKHKGKRVIDEKSYVNWMLGGEFTMNTKQILKKIIQNG